MLNSIAESIAALSGFDIREKGGSLLQRFEAAAPTFVSGGTGRGRGTGYLSWIIGRPGWTGYWCLYTRL